MLQRRYCYSMTGRTGSGKTAIALNIAASVALGRSIGGHDVERGRVLYFAGENPTDVQMRWIAMAQQMNFDVNDIDVHFTCF
jgi:RecA-family ATPase